MKAYYSNQQHHNYRPARRALLIVSLICYYLGPAIGLVKL